MAVVFMEGFDHLSAADSANYKGWIGGWNGGTVAGRLGGQSASTAGGTPTTHALPASYSTLILGFAFLSSNLSGTQNDFAIMQAGVTLAIRFSIRLSGPNLVVQLKNAGGTVLATGTTPLFSNAWYYFETKVVISATVGTVELRLNGASTAECSGTGLNTGSSNIDTIGFATAGGFCQFDDICCVDTTGSAPTNTWLGDVRIETLLPSGNGANTAWAGVYTDIDDPTTIDVDTTYISSPTPGDKETVALTNLTVTAGTVFAVQTNITARKDDAGTRTIAPVVRIGGVDYDGTTTANLSQSYLDYRQIYDRLDPSGAGWTVATVNAMEAGVKEVG